MKLIRVNAWNIGLALAGMILTFLFNIGNNVLLTSVLRSLYSLPCFFVLIYVIRMVLNAMLEGETTVMQEDGTKGRHVDIVTPEDEGLLDDDAATGEVAATEKVDNTEKIGEVEEAKEAEDSFTPLEPPKVTAGQEIDPDLVLKAVRQLSQE